MKSKFSSVLNYWNEKKEWKFPENFKNAWYDLRKIVKELFFSIAWRNFGNSEFLKKF